jgi:hypothetical protein
MTLAPSRAATSRVWSVEPVSTVNGTQSWFGYNGQSSYTDFDGSGSLTMRYLTDTALRVLSR